MATRKSTPPDAGGVEVGGLAADDVHEFGVGEHLSVVDRRGVGVRGRGAGEDVDERAAGRGLARAQELVGYGFQ